jgi:hypothetical protein
VTVLRTAADVRSYFLTNWRQLVPDLLAPQCRVGPAPEDERLVQIELREGRPVRRLLLVPLASGEPRLLRGLLPRLRQLGVAPDTWPGLAVPHMGASGVKVCREAGAGFIDCCGNALLRFNQVVVQISGNRNKFSARKRPRTLFNDKATIPLRILLADPAALVTTREIAERGGMSIGWVSQILQQLHAEGYVERKRGGGTRLVDPLRLLDDWVQQYAFEHNAVFPFRMREPAAGETLDRLRELPAPLQERYALTLEAAFAAISPASEPEALHLYLPDLAIDKDRALDTWAEALRLRPAGHGADCFLVAPAYTHAAFFGIRRAGGLRMVSDLQLYLDLFHYPAAARRQAQAAVLARLPFAAGETAH